MRGFQETDALVAGILDHLWDGEDVSVCAPHVYGFPWSWDVEGAVRVLHGPPVAVTVEAAIAVCAVTPALLAELNALMTRGQWLRFYCEPGEGIVYASYALLAGAVAPQTLSAAIDWVRYAAASFGPLLPLAAEAPS